MVEKKNKLCPVTAAGNVRNQIVESHTVTPGVTV